MFFSFQLTKSFCSRSQKFLYVEAGSGVKKSHVWSQSLKLEFRFRSPALG